MTTWFEQYLACWDNHDVEGVLAWMTDDALYEDVTLGHAARGRDGLRRFVEASFANVPQAKMDFVGGFDDGESYAFQWVMQPMGVRGASVGRLRDGKIVENHDYWNGALFSVPNT
jgi:ketosteroid isomerase-like protein